MLMNPNIQYHLALPNASPPSFPKLSSASYLSFASLQHSPFYHLSQCMTKPIKLHVRPAKTPISLGIRLCSPYEESLCPQLPMECTAKTNHTGRGAHASFFFFIITLKTQSLLRHRSAKLDSNVSIRYAEDTIFYYYVWDFLFATTVIRLEPNE